MVIRMPFALFYKTKRIETMQTRQEAESYALKNHYVEGDESDPKRDVYGRYILKSNFKIKEVKTF